MLYSSKKKGIISGNKDYLVAGACVEWDYGLHEHFFFALAVLLPPSESLIS